MANTLPPLAERLRPRSLDDYIGQTHLVGEGGVVRRMIQSGSIASFILWGPPGVGKTTLARIVSGATGNAFFTLSAVTAGVKEVREVLDRCKAESVSVFSKGRPILFIDEIHRFNKAQQDSLLGAVENGTVTLRLYAHFFRVLRFILSGRLRLWTCRSCLIGLWRLTRFCQDAM